MKLFKRENFEKTSKMFFELPAEAKYKVRRELSKNTFRGYYGSVSFKSCCVKYWSKKRVDAISWREERALKGTSNRPGVESTNGNPDIKEAFTWGPGLLRGSISTWYHGPNLIPDDIDQIQEIFDAYCAKMMQFGISLLQAFEDAFNIPGYLMTKFNQEKE